MTVVSVNEFRESVQVGPQVSNDRESLLRYFNRQLDRQRANLADATLVPQRDDAERWIAHYTDMVQMLEVGA